ncbi:hypothetical protein Trydic_g2176 [Trypoxylus dichotomus]
MLIVRQGCVLSLLLFNAYSEESFTTALQSEYGGIRVNGSPLNNLRYVDATVLLSKNMQDLQNMLNNAIRVSQEYGLIFNVKKTRYMIGPKLKCPINIYQEAAMWPRSEPRPKNSDAQMLCICSPFVRCRNVCPKHALRTEIRSLRAVDLPQDAENAMDRTCDQRRDSGKNERGRGDPTGSKKKEIAISQSHHETSEV